MSDIDLNALSLDDLKKLQKDVAKAIAGYNDRKRKEALAAADAVAKEFGFSLADLAGSPKSPRATKAAQPPKYVHPESPAVTWSGRGRQPGWIKEALAMGRSIEELLIAKVTGRKKKT